MTLDRILVTVAGIAAIGWVYWYFFRAAHAGAASRPAEGHHHD